MDEDDRPHNMWQAMGRKNRESARELLDEGGWKWLLPWNLKGYFYLKSFAAPKEKKHAKPKQK